MGRDSLCTGKKFRKKKENLKTLQRAKHTFYMRNVCTQTCTFEMHTHTHTHRGILNPGKLRRVKLIVTTVFLTAKTENS